MIHEGVQHFDIEKIIDPENPLKDEFQCQHDKTSQNGDRHQSLADKRDTASQHIGKQYDDSDDAQLHDQIPYTGCFIEDLLYLRSRNIQYYHSFYSTSLLSSIHARR